MRYKLCAERILFDVPHKREVVCVSIHYERLIPSLVEVTMTDRAVRCMPALCLRFREPTHKRLNVTVLFWLKCEMEVVGHNGVCRDTHVSAFNRLLEHLFKL
jgi:hypothetical protein